MPLYWLHEETGEMKDIVFKFINYTTLTKDELNTLKWYVHQWASAMPCHPPDLNRIFEMDQIQLKNYIFDVLLLEYSIDVF